MKFREWTIFALSLLFIFAVFAGCNESGTNALPESEDSLSPEEPFATGQVIQLTDVEDRANRLEPDIDGDRIVWLERSTPVGKLLLYDLSTKEGRLLPSSSLILVGNAPKISKDRIVWSEGTPGILAIYDLATESKRRIITRFNQTEPEIFVDKIVWRAVSPRVRFDIHLYDVLSEVETPIAFENSPEQIPQATPVIWEDIIAWADRRNGPSDIVVYDSANEIELFATDENADQETPAIWESRVVWVDERNGNADIYMYDLESQTETQITDDPADQIDPAIFGDYIVWEDFRNGNRDIFLYNLATNTERQITFDERDQFDPAISGNTLVWAGICESMVYSDIFIYKIPDGN